MRTRDEIFQLWIEAVSRDVKASSIKVELLSRSLRDVDHAVVTISQLLDYSRSECH